MGLGEKAVRPMGALARIAWRGVARARAWRIRRALVRIYQLQPLILLVESTGFGPDDQIIEICLLDAWDLHTVFRSRIDPTVPIRHLSERRHGISEGVLVGMPRFRKIETAISDALRGRALVGYDLLTDLRLLQQTYQASERHMPELGPVCSVSSVWAGVYGKRVSLAAACSQIENKAKEYPLEPIYSVGIAISKIIWHLLPRAVIDACVPQQEIS